ncbi:DUF4215 domain-containing protein [Nannocystis sp. SCPEA4]|uniref:DUF4215 domain-containing protein n=1 Tax=Nannocystis sp. SCPEA4 TaxID=2996787 RepID=UPI00227117E0|nr:DUF4215 domain-containing protein [Nannocystis sp. SCPEA4]MCY1054028.1 hypothetical protein [Nannocystis sp. SCPEA4]
MFLRRPLAPWILVLLLDACAFDGSGLGEGEPASTSGMHTGTTEPATSTPTTSDVSISSTVGPVCGDGVVDPGEECDDGPDNADTAACTSHCTHASCGDGWVGPGEGCDDGNAVGGDGCSASCASETCGDGVVQADAGEECDEGEGNGPGQACTGICKHNVCGDADIGPDEACDDGNQDAGDACTTACKNAVCGDGIVQVGVEACDDGNAADGDACLATCVAATCGDGVVHEGVEECDDADGDNADECIDTCNSAKCGDGFVHTGQEECDDSNLSNGDGCSSSCARESRRVFVSSKEYKGDLGGIAGADALCQTLADSKSLGGTWKAWITADAGPDSSPSVRFVHSAGPYILLDQAQTKIADNWTDLTDGSLDAPIAVYENGQNAGGETLVWTNTLSSGTGFVGLQDCVGWENSTNTAQGFQGDRTRTDGAWSNTNLFDGCDKTKRLFCFEQ